MNHAEGTDIHPQLHGWGTKKSAHRVGTDLGFIGQFSGFIQIPLGPETLLAIQARFVIQLTGMILTTKTLHGGEVTAVESLKESVGLWGLILIGAALDDISLDRGAITGFPYDAFQAQPVNPDLFVLFTAGRE